MKKMLKCLASSNSFNSIFYKNFISDEKDAEMHYHDGEDALVCGDKFDDTVDETVKSESSEITKPNTEENNTNNQVALNKKEKEDIKNSKSRFSLSNVFTCSSLLVYK